MALLKEVDLIKEIQDHDYCYYKNAEKTILDCDRCIKDNKGCVHTQKIEKPKDIFVCPKCGRPYPVESKEGDTYCFNCADLILRIDKGTVTPAALEIR